MKIAQIKEVARHAIYLLDKHSPVILTGVALATGVTAVILASKATTKATRIVDAENTKRIEEEKEKMTNWEVVKEVAPEYIPTALTLFTSLTCMVASTAILNKRNAALMGITAFAANELKDREDKIKELFGERKAQQARVAVEEDRMRKSEDFVKNPIITGHGDTLCRDCLSGQMFRSSVEKIHYAINAANKDLLDVGYISLNDVYYLLGLDQTQIGDEQGWHIEQGLINISFDSALTKDDEPVLLVRFVNLPRYRYN